MRSPREKVRVTLGGKPAEVLYAGAAPHFVAGLLEVNFRVPMDAPAGSAVPLILTVGNASSRSTVTMAVRSEQQRVLVIDRNPAVLEWYRRVLAAEGYEITVARDDREALLRTGGELVDAVISDLPVSSAMQIRVETLRRIEGSRPQLRIAATVPANVPHAVASADLLGAQAVFARPLRAVAVKEQLRKLLTPLPVYYDAPPPDRGPLAYPVRRGSERH